MVWLMGKGGERSTPPASWPPSLRAVPHLGAGGVVIVVLSGLNSDGRGGGCGRGPGAAGGAHPGACTGRENCGAKTMEGQRRSRG